MLSMGHGFKSRTVRLLRPANNFWAIPPLFSYKKHVFKDGYQLDTQEREKNIQLHLFIKQT